MAADGGAGGDRLERRVVLAAPDAFAEPAQKSALLSRGISEAMYNTALGLGIAVLCMFFHMVLHGWSKRIKHDLERTQLKLENLLTLKRE